MNSPWPRPIPALAALALSGALGALATGCGSSGSSSSGATATSAPATSSAKDGSTAGGSSLRVATTPKFASPSRSSPVRSGKVVIAYRNITINPDTLRVKAGTTVTWTNYDEIDHNVTSVGAAQHIASGNLGGGRSFQVKLTTRGILHYECTIHPVSMNGTIEVL